MADNEKQREQKQHGAKANVGTSDPTAASGTDADAGANVGVAEGELKALRMEAGLNQLAGSEANVLAWEASTEGQRFLSEEKERLKRVKDENKQAEDERQEVDEATAKYREALNAGREGTQGR